MTRVNQLIRASITMCVLCMLLPSSSAESASVVAPDRPTLVLDGDTFITFYDLPSRRFRALRGAFVEGDEVGFQRDLAVSIEYLGVEIQRMDPRLGGAMHEVIAGFDAVSISSGAAVTELDALFSRAHWLLAQHFLLTAQSRLLESGAATPAIYLIATAHHLERAALWSGAGETPKLAQTLDELRASAGNLRKYPHRDQYQRLIARTAGLLKDLSKVINRPVRVELN